MTRGVAAFSGNGTTTIAASYAIAVYDTKTGDRISYGTAKFPARGHLSGYSPPWENCSNAMWAASEDTLTADQKTSIRAEFWSLITRSLPHALFGSGLISKSDADALMASASTAADPSCKAV